MADARRLEPINGSRGEVRIEPDRASSLVEEVLDNRPHRLSHADRETFAVEVDGLPMILKVSRQPPTPWTCPEKERWVTDIVRSRGTIPVPQVYAAASRHPRMPVSFCLEERLPGVDGQQLYRQGDVEVRRALWTGLARVIRGVSAVDENWTSPGTISGEGPQEVPMADWRELLYKWHAWPLLQATSDPKAQQVANRLRRVLLDDHLEVEHFRPSLVHGDPSLQNILVDPTRPSDVTGLIDWTLALVGDPLLDIAWLLLLPEEYPPKWKSVLEDVGIDFGDMRGFAAIRMYSLLQHVLLSAYVNMGGHGSETTQVGLEAFLRETEYLVEEYELHQSDGIESWVRRTYHLTERE